MTNPKDIIIALDDGHGMETPGKRTPKFSDGSFMHENEFNRAVIFYLDKELKRLGFKTVLVAPTDADTLLATRVKTANNAKANIYVAAHANALTEVKFATHGGIETFCFKFGGQGEKLARIVHKNVIKGTPLRDRGVKEGNFYVLRETNMPAVLIEYGFMDNLLEAKLLKSDAYRKECARETAMGICEYYGVKYVEEVIPTPPPIPTPPKVEEKIVPKVENVSIENTPNEWAKESWNKAKIKGILDGTNPKEPLTREQLAMVLDRLGLLN